MRRLALVLLGVRLEKEARCDVGLVRPRHGAAVLPVIAVQPVELAFTACAKTSYERGTSAGTHGALGDVRIGLAPAHDVRVEDRLAQPHMEVRGGVEVADELVLVARERLGEELPVQRDRPLVHAA